MNILLLGNGGREHAIAKTLKRSPQNPKIFTFANAKNPGICKISEEYEICSQKNFGEEDGFTHLKKFAEENKIDFTILGPDDPIGAGAADSLLKVGVKSVGPLKSLARLESSKSFTRNLLEKYGIPGNPEFKVFISMEGMNKFCEHLEGNFVIKDDGLCGGKGVHVSGDHFSTLQEGLRIAEKILKEHGKLVIEEKFIGQEFSLMYFTDGNVVKPMPVVQDHKRAFEGDTGPNTGGMGTYSYPENLPFLTAQHLEEAREITEQTMRALEKECGSKYMGIMYGGFIATKKGTRLIEYNSRFGDPEGLNVLPLLESDLVEICLGIINGNLSEKEVRFAKKATVCKYVCPEGYPSNPVKSAEITIGDVPKNVEVFFSSIDEIDGKFTLKGSRAIGFVGIADDIFEAEKLAEKACNAVSGPVFHRRDIGTKELIEKRIEMMMNL
ncbi:phosphoribosylamine--glycine ligase [Candidatus Peregrinibacteria bacterium]|nr:phosphoribosylamine--glycine ligase [Candidatus Peregrinibacteria bacterium]